MDPDPDPESPKHAFPAPDPDPQQCFAGNVLDLGPLDSVFKSRRAKIVTKLKKGKS